MNEQFVCSGTPAQIHKLPETKQNRLTETGLSITIIRTLGIHELAYEKES